MNDTPITRIIELDNLSDYLKVVENLVDFYRGNPEGFDEMAAKVEPIDPVVGVALATIRDIANGKYI